MNTCVIILLGIMLLGMLGLIILANNEFDKTDDLQDVLKEKREQEEHK